MPRAMLALAVLTAATLASLGTTAAAATGYSGPNAVAIPYLGEIVVKPAPGWTVADCAAPLAATDLLVECSAEELRFATDAWDASLGTVIVPVPLTNGRTTIGFDYRVTLAPPEAPAVRPAAAAHPIAAGTTVLVPLTDLGIECSVCTDGGFVDVGAVEPAEAGTASALPMHVRFTASASFSGTAEIAVRFGDRFGSWSQPVQLPVHVYTDSDGTLQAMSVWHERTPGSSSPLSIRELVQGAGADAAVLVGCGSAAHGIVVCSPDGNVLYAPADDAAVDQFSYHVATPSGEQASGSVTLATASSGLPTSGPIALAAPADPDPDDSVATSFIPPPPVEETGGSTGIFDPLLGLFARVDA